MFVRGLARLLTRMASCPPILSLIVTTYLAVVFKIGNFSYMHSEFIDETELQKEAQMLVQGHKLLQKLIEATASERQVILIAYIQEQIAKAVGISASQLDVQQPLNYMGIDSLIAVKLRNRVRTDLEVDVPAVKFMEDTSVVNLATQLSQQILPKEREHLSQKAISDNDWLEGEI